MLDSLVLDALTKRQIDFWQRQLAQISADSSITEVWRFVFESAETLAQYYLLMLSRPSLFSLWTLVIWA